MTQKKPEKLSELSRTKLTGYVKLKTHEIFKIASIMERKPIGQLLDIIANTHELLIKHARKEDNSI